MIRHGLNSTPADTETVGPLLNSLGIIVQGDEGVSPRIVHLLFTSRPFAIFWGVISIVINSVYRVFSCRALTHVSKKDTEGIKPLLTHCDTASEVVLAPRIAWIITTSSDIKPREIFRTARHTMSSASGYCHLGRKTPARTNTTPSKIFASNDCQVSAFTTAIPCGDFSFSDIFGTRDDCKSVMGISHLIFEGYHNILREMLFRLKSIVATDTEYSFRPLNLATDLCYHKYAIGVK